MRLVICSEVTVCFDGMVILCGYMFWYLLNLDSSTCRVVDMMLHCVMKPDSDIHGYSHGMLSLWLG